MTDQPVCDHKFPPALPDGTCASCGKPRQPSPPAPSGGVAASGHAFGMAWSTTSTPAPSGGGALTDDERTSVAVALAAWRDRGPTSLTVALLADALYGVAERYGIDERADAFGDLAVARDES
jgi:hypothetical protein